MKVLSTKLVSYFFILISLSFFSSCKKSNNSGSARAGEMTINIIKNGVAKTTTLNFDQGSWGTQTSFSDQEGICASCTPVTTFPVKYFDVLDSYNITELEIYFKEQPQVNKVYNSIGITEMSWAEGLINKPFTTVAMWLRSTNNPDGFEDIGGYFNYYFKNGNLKVTNITSTTISFVFDATYPVEDYNGTIHNLTFNITANSIPLNFN